MIRMKCIIVGLLCFAIQSQAGSQETVPIHRLYDVHFGETTMPAQIITGEIADELGFGSSTQIALSQHDKLESGHHRSGVVGPFAEPVVAELVRRRICEKLSTTGTVRFRTLDAPVEYPLEFLVAPKFISRPGAEFASLSNARGAEAGRGVLDYIAAYRVAAAKTAGRNGGEMIAGEVVLSIDSTSRTASVTENYQSIVDDLSLPVGDRLYAAKSLADVWHYYRGTTKDRIISYALYQQLLGLAIANDWNSLRDSVLLEILGLVVELGQSGIGGNSASSYYALTVAGDREFSASAPLSSRRQATARLIYLELGIIDTKRYVSAADELKAFGQVALSSGFRREYRMSLYQAGRAATLLDDRHQDTVACLSALLSEAELDDPDWFYFRGERMCMSRAAREILQQPAYRSLHKLSD